MIKIPLVAACLLASAVLSLAPAAGQVSYRKVVDASAALPGVNGTLHGFGHAALGKGTVAFICYEEFWQRMSIFTERNGVFQRVATTNESQADGITFTLGPYAYESAPMFRPSGSLVFQGLSNSNYSFFEWNGGNLVKLFDSAQAEALVGPGAEMYSEVPVMTADGRLVRELDDGIATVLVQHKDGQLSVLQRADVPLPPSGTTGKRFSAWAAFEDGAVFHEYMVTDQIYRRAGSKVQLLAQENSTGFPGLPPGMSTTTSLKADPRLTVMTARRNLAWPDTAYGLYGWAGGSWFTIAETGMPAPGGGTYTGMTEYPTNLSLENGTLIFQAATTMLGESIFMYRQGTVTPLAWGGLNLNGAVVHGVGLGGYALSGNEVAFTAYMTDASKNAVYVADISPLMTPDTGKLTVRIARRVGNTVDVAVPGRPGYIYYLYRSSDLGTWTVVDQKLGNEGEVLFTQSGSDVPKGRAFYRVEEVRR